MNLFTINHEPVRPVSLSGTFLGSSGMLENPPGWLSQAWPLCRGPSQVTQVCPSSSTLFPHHSILHCTPPPLFPLRRWAAAKSPATPPPTSSPNGQTLHSTTFRFGKVAVEFMECALAQARTHVHARTQRRVRGFRMASEGKMM